MSIVIDSKNINVDDNDDNDLKSEDYYEFIFCEDNKEKCSLENIFSNKPIFVSKSLFIYDKETKDCKWEREEKEMEIAPAEGEVFYVKCRDKRYVMKIIPLTSWIPFKSSTLLNNFHNEVDFLQKASKIHISPKIMKVYVSEEWGVIIMEDAGIGLRSYVKNFLELYGNINEKSDEEIKEIKDIIDKKTNELVDDFYKLYIKLHSIGICHNDLYLRNITYNDEKNRMYFIDYGYATNNKDCYADLMDFLDDVADQGETSKGRKGITVSRYFWILFLDKIESKLKQNKDSYYESKCIIL